jgi:hypothetical protein
MTRARHRSEQAEPVSTFRDETHWISLEHLPVGERWGLIDRLPTDEATFPRRRMWSKERGRYVYAAPIDRTSPRDIELMTRVLMYRMEGHARPWPQRPRDPYEVPVVPSGLRAAWEADALWDAMLGHFSGEHPLPGIPSMTREEFLAMVRGPTQTPETATRS